MRIAEVAEEYGISADTLRYYERIGLLPRVRRNASGIRDYDEDDCMRVSFIKCMRGANVSIEALIEYMQLFEQGDATLEARKQILIEQRDAARERLERIQRGLIAWITRSPITTSFSPGMAAASPNAQSPTSRPTSNSPLSRDS